MQIMYIILFIEFTVRKECIIASHLKIIHDILVVVNICLYIIYIYIVSDLGYL